MKSFLNEKSFVDLNKSDMRLYKDSPKSKTGDSQGKSVNLVTDTPEACIEKALENRFGAGLIKLFVECYGFETNKSTSNTEGSKNHLTSF